MGIDYVVDLDCSPKQALSIEKIIALIKSRNQIATIVEMARRDGDERPSEEITFTRMVMRPEGPTEQQVSVRTLLQQVGELEPHVQHCDGCEANLCERPFGCYGYISYPIPVAAEEWLMSLLPADLESSGGYILQSAVADFEYDGGMFLDMRPQDMFFESPTPVERTWASFALTSDQLLQMLFGLGGLQTGHCQMMCLILGMIQTEDEEPHSLPQPPEEAIEMAYAINALALAASLEVSLLIDA